MVLTVDLTFSLLPFLFVCSYLVMFVAFVYFGGRVCSTAVHNKRIFYRVLLLTSVCGLAMFGKGCSLVAAAAKDWRTDTIFLSSVGR